MGNSEDIQDHGEITNPQDHGEVIDNNADVFDNEEYILSNEEQTDDSSVAQSETDAVDINNHDEHINDEHINGQWDDSDGEVYVEDDIIDDLNMEEVYHLFHNVSKNVHIIFV